MGVPTQLFYDEPLHRRGPYRAFPRPRTGLPVTEALAREVISLPFHPYLDARDQARVIAGVRSAAAA